MGFIPIDNIVRDALANKGYDTLHKYVIYLHWAIKGLEKLQKEPSYTDIKYTKEFLDSNNVLPFPENMRQWIRLGIVDSTGHITMFTHKNTMSLDPLDRTRSKGAASNRGLFAFGTGREEILKSTNIYVSSDTGVVEVTFANQNRFRVDYANERFIVERSIGDNEVYLEYIAKATDPSAATMVDELATEFIIDFIYYREARFQYGDSHRETQARLAQWLDTLDELREEISDLTGDSLIDAMNQYTRRTILQ
jgi:hypothetical protein